jgi:hypothetical protein
MPRSPSRQETGKGRHADRSTPSRHVNRHAHSQAEELFIMPNIRNDHDLRDALQGLTADQQRILGSRFAEHVLHMSLDERVNRAVAVGLRDQLSPGELEDAFKSAKAYATKTYTDCGKDTDWNAQADHFVAAAAAAALTPEALLGDKQNRAWKAAMQARMAVNCTLVEADDVPETSEAEHQYGIAETFLS